MKLKSYYDENNDKNSYTKSKSYYDETAIQNKELVR